MEPKWEDKYKTWEKLRELNGQYDLPWFIIGDFSAILFSHEERGVANALLFICKPSLVLFQTSDLTIWVLLGTNFTWKRGSIRLDRVVANNSWSVMPPVLVLLYSTYSIPNHTIVRFY
jgi:hypothetical protein